MLRSCWMAGTGLPAWKHTKKCVLECQVGLNSRAIRETSSATRLREWIRNNYSELFTLFLEVEVESNLKRNFLASLERGAVKKCQGMSRKYTPEYFLEVRNLNFCAKNSSEPAESIKGSKIQKIRQTTWGDKHQIFGNLALAGKFGAWIQLKNWQKLA